MKASVSKKDFEDFKVTINAKLAKLDKLDIIFSSKNYDVKTRFSFP